MTSKRDELLALAERVLATPAYTAKALRCWRTPKLYRCDKIGDDSDASVILIDSSQRGVLAAALRALAEMEG